MKAEVFMATPCTKSLGCVGGSIIRSEEVRGANLDVRQRFFVGSGRPVGVDLARRIPRYHETSRDLERVEESGAAVLEPRSVWLRSVVENLKEASWTRSPTVLTVQI